MENELTTKYVELTANCAGRINNLDQMITKVRGEKQNLLIIALLSAGSFVHKRTRTRSFVESKDSGVDVSRPETSSGFRDKLSEKYNQCLCHRQHTQPNAVKVCLSSQRRQYQQTIRMQPVDRMWKQKVMCPCKKCKFLLQPPTDEKATSTMSGHFYGSEIEQFQDLGTRARERQLNVVHIIHNIMR